MDDFSHLSKQVRSFQVVINGFPIVNLHHQIPFYYILLDEPTSLEMVNGFSCYSTGQGLVWGELSLTAFKTEILCLPYKIILFVRNSRSYVLRNVLVCVPSFSMFFQKMRYCWMDLPTIRVPGNPCIFK